MRVSSPLSASSCVMSAPPTSSPPTKSCGIVGQPDSSCSSWRIAGSGRTFTAVTGAPASRSARSARSEFPHIPNCGVPVTQRLGERVVHQAVLVEQRDPVEAGARHDHLKVVAAAGAVLDAELVRIGERAAQQRFETLDGHAVIVLTARPLAGEGT